jgi:uridine phosphorylase
MKKTYPILEFDQNPVALFNPEDVIKNKRLPSRLILCFFNDVINHLLKEDKIFPIETYYSESGPSIVYQFRNVEIAIVLGSLGGPASVGFLEEYIASGVKSIILCGGAGVLVKEIPLGGLLVVDSAIRDEGTSYHYVRPSREIKANPSIVKLIQYYLIEHQIPHQVGKTWTTDAFYRETQDKIALRKQEKALVVEMEQASIMALTQFRNVKYGAILYGGDDLSDVTWDHRFWQSRSEIRRNLVEICQEIIQYY